MTAPVAGSRVTVPSCGAPMRSPTSGRVVRPPPTPSRRVRWYRGVVGRGDAARGWSVHTFMTVDRHRRRVAHRCRLRGVADLVVVGVLAAGAGVRGVGDRAVGADGRRALARRVVTVGVGERLARRSRVVDQDVDTRPALPASVVAASSTAVTTFAPTVTRTVARKHCGVGEVVSHTCTEYESSPVNPACGE